MYKMVGSRGIEPPTYSLGNCRSILLSYDPTQKHVYDYISNSASRTINNAIIPYDNRISFGMTSF